MDVKNICEKLGFKVTREGNKFLRTTSLFSKSGNTTSLRINARSGWFTDYSGQIKGSLSDLVKLTLGLQSYDEAKSWLINNEFSYEPVSEKPPLIEDFNTYFPADILEKLVKNHTYWIGRGVSEDVIKQYKGGVAASGSLINRYIFPIFDENGRIVGFAGRDLTGKSPIKWKLIGKKSSWIFPQTSLENIKNSRTAIIVESIGDHLALECAGIHNSIVLFGIELSDKILSKLCGLNPKRIILGLNNDTDNGGVGQKNADKIKKKLDMFFDTGVTILGIPPSPFKDFGEMNSQQIKNYYEQIKS